MKPSGSWILPHRRIARAGTALQAASNHTLLPAVRICKHRNCLQHERQTLGLMPVIRDFERCSYRQEAQPTGPAQLC